MDKQLARLFALLLLAVPCIAQAPNQTQQVRTYYVDAITPGSDANPGTAASPFATVAHVASIAATGNARVFVKFPNLTWQQLQMPYLDLKLLFIAQQGSSATTLYDVANGDHATITAGAWVTGNGINGLKFNGTSTYASFTPVVGGRNFITYVVTSLNASSSNPVWSEDTSSGPTSVIALGAGYIPQPSYLKDLSGSTTTVYNPGLTANTQFAGSHVQYAARNGATFYSGVADQGTVNSGAAPGGTVSTNTAAIGAFDQTGVVSYFWNGTVEAVAIYLAYPSAATFKAQYYGLRELMFTQGNLLPMFLNDSDLTPGPVWLRQGALFGEGVNGYADAAQEPSVIYEGNCHIVSSPCFKMWFSTGSGSSSETGMSYAESTTALPTTWSFYSGNPILTGLAYSCVIKVGSSYYMYTANGSTNNLDLYNSSDGITWTLTAANVVTKGAAGSADANGLYNSWVVYDGSIWRMVYEANSSGVPSSPAYTSLTATSADGITWTKNQGSVGGYNGNGFSGPFFTIIDGQFWLWGQASYLSSGATGTDLFRSTGWNFKGILQNYPQASTFPRGSAADEAHQVADEDLVELHQSCPGTSSTDCTYMFYGSVSNDFGGNTGQYIKLAVAPMTIRQLVLTTEGATTTSP